MKVIDLFETNETGTNHHPLITNPMKAYKYARDIIKGRWKEAEKYIMEDPSWACSYAKKVINMGKQPEEEMIRWKEAEKYIMEDPSWAFFYAKDVIKGRWKEAEPIIMEDLESAYMYAKYVIVPFTKTTREKHQFLLDNLWVKDKDSYDFIIKQFFHTSSLLVNKWIRFGDRARSQIAKGKWK